MKQQALLGDHSDFVYSVAFGPDGKTLASCSKDRSVKVFDATSGKSLLTFSGMDQDVLAVAYSPDGKNIVSSGYESGVYWWNAQTGERIRLQNGHGIAVHELCFSKDGKLLASAGADNTARLWNGENGAPLKALAVGSVTYAVALSPDGRQVATGSFDGFIRLWDVTSGRLLLTLIALPSARQPAWVAMTPEGYFDQGGESDSNATWRANGQAVIEQMWKPLQNAELVAKGCRGETVPVPLPQVEVKK
jgi:WD40 repeat protein